MGFNVSVHMSIETLHPIQFNSCDKEIAVAIAPCELPLEVFLFNMLYTPNYLS